MYNYKTHISSNHKTCKILTGLKKMTQNFTWYLETYYVRDKISGNNTEKTLTVTNKVKTTFWTSVVHLGHLKVLVHLLQLHHGMPNVPLQ